jgi:hypothetical protein
MKTGGKHRGNTLRFRHRQGLLEEDSNSSGNNNKNLQMGLHQIKKLLHSKRNSQQSEETA